MSKYRFQIKETYIGDDKRAWAVIDTQDNDFIVDVFTIKADAKYFASKWSKQNV
jgi:hypothetical protein